MVVLADARKAENPMPNAVSQQLVRIPNVYKGAAAGASVGLAEAMMTGECSCAK